MHRVLLIEDNEMNRDMLSRRLARRGFEVLTAADAEAGMEMARSERPAVILMDISLPGMNGWDATRKLKSDPETTRIPVIALTAHALSTDREKAMEAGCDEYETKPVDLQSLLAKMDSLLARGVETV